MESLASVSGWPWMARHSQQRCADVLLMFHPTGLGLGRGWSPNQVIWIIKAKPISLHRHPQPISIPRNFHKGLIYSHEWPASTLGWEYFKVDRGFLGSLNSWLPKVYRSTPWVVQWLPLADVNSVAHSKSKWLVVTIRLTVINCYNGSIMVNGYIMVSLWTVNNKLFFPMFSLLMFGLKLQEKMIVLGRAMSHGTWNPRRFVVVGKH